MRSAVFAFLLACSTTPSSPDAAATNDASSSDVVVADAANDVETNDAPADAPNEASACTSPSGQAMPVGDLTGWHQVFTDDFTVDVPVGSFPAAVSSKWTAYLDGWKDTSKNGTYMPSKVLSVGCGILDMNIHTENGVHMVSAPEPVIPGGNPGIEYGRYVVRFRSDAIPGYKTAWLLWPDSENWPTDGEIDFPEGNLDGAIGAFMHHMYGDSGASQDGYSSKVTYTAWHTADLVWSATACSFTLDGVLLGTSTSLIPSTPMHYVLQTETQLSGGAPADSASGHVQVDWVVVYVPQ